MIQLKDLTQSFPKKQIFRTLNQTFSSHNIHIIQGSNGSGKSTFLKICAGQLPPDKGKVLIQGNSIYDLKSPHHLSALSRSEPEGFFINATVKENLAFFTSLNTNLDLEALQRRNQFFSLEQYLNTEYQALSSGNKKKLSLSLTLASQTPLLLFDEPLNFLDKKARQFFLSELSQVQTMQKKIILIATNQHFSLSQTKNWEIKQGQLHEIHS